MSEQRLCWCGQEVKKRFSLAAKTCMDSIFHLYLIQEYFVNGSVGFFLIFMANILKFTDVVNWGFQLWFTC